VSTRTNTTPTPAAAAAAATTTTIILHFRPCDQSEFFRVVFLLFGFILSRSSAAIVSDFIVVVFVCRLFLYVISSGDYYNEFVTFLVVYSVGVLRR